MSSSPSSPVRARPAPARTLWLVVVPLIALGTAALFIALSLEITGREALYPQLLAALVAALAVVSLRRDYVEARRITPDAAAAPATTDGTPGSVEPDLGLLDAHEEGGEELEGRRGEGVAWKRVGVLVGLVALSIYLMSWLGFFLPAALLVGAGLVVLGVRSWWRVLVYTAGLIVGAYLLFVEALSVPFPPLPWS